jgi:hypothetical protein
MKPVVSSNIWRGVSYALAIEAGFTAIVWALVRLVQI